MPLTPYVAASLFLLFFAALFAYAGLGFLYQLLLSIVAVASLVVGLDDRVSYNGRRLVRTGPLSAISHRLWGRPRALRIRSVESAETYIKRFIKRNDNFYYCYRVILKGRGVEFEFDTSLRGHRSLINAVLSKLPESSLDIRSIEIRDYLSDASDLLRQARAAQIPPPDVLEGSIRRAKGSKGSASSRHALNEGDPNSVEKARELQLLGNKLRVSGYLLQSAEALRRALRLNPGDGWLLLDLGRCIEEFAGALHDRTLARRSLAILRLAERRAQSDPKLLERLADTYLLAGEADRAARSYQKAIAIVDNSFRAVRGMAEVALFQGKLAHAVLHFSAASRTANHPALRRWTSAEAQYLSRLSESDEYMDIEIGRLNLLGSLSRSAQTSLRLGLWGLPLILSGLLVGDSLIADIGWAVSAVAFLAWAVLTISARFFVERIPFDIVDEQD